MSTFGIRISEFGDSDKHFVCEDDVLFDWLLANNYGPSDEDSMFIVPAPAGYVFWKGKVIADNSPKLENRDESELSKSATVTSGSAENDKALMLLEEAMSFMKRASFYALGLDEDRVLEYMIY
jgi:hypothetical protein